MHRCLQIPEIVLWIVDTEVLSSHNPDRKTLLSLSLACKWFMEPCLDVIWHRLDYAGPLLNLIAPLDQRLQRADVGIAETHQEVMNLSRLIEKTDWNRVRYYASRVKELAVYSSDIDDLLVRALAMRLPTQSTPLLRNLRYLYWPDGTVESFAVLRFFTGPKLKEISLGIPPWPKECEGFLCSTFSSIAENCPLLQELLINNQHEYRFSWGDDGAQLSYIFSTLPTLTHIIFSSWPSADTVKTLSTMPNLRNLDAIFEASSPAPFLWDSRSLLEFPALQHLKWPVFDLSEATKLLLCLRSRNRRKLESFHIECDNDNFETTELDTFVHAIHATFSFHSLKSLSVHAFRKPEMPLSNPDFARSLLRPLLDFSRIEVLRLSRLPVEWDDTFLNEISTGWRYLRVLELRARDATEARITIAGLQSLAKCFQLRNLEIDLACLFGDASPSARQSSESAPQNTNTKLVRIWHKIEDPELEESNTRRAAGKQLLQNTFPNARFRFHLKRGQATHLLPG